jgi:hypothetical protein
LFVNTTLWYNCQDLRPFPGGIENEPSGVSNLPSETPKDTETVIGASGDFH